jgi:hypothetical protein
VIFLPIAFTVFSAILPGNRHVPITTQNIHPKYFEKKKTIPTFAAP